MFAKIPTNHEKQINTYHLFVDYKAAFDIPIRGKFYEAMSELGISAKLIRLCRMTLRNAKSSVKVGKGLIIRCKARLHTKRSPIVRSLQHLNGDHNKKSCSEACCPRKLMTAVFSRIEKISTNLGLAVNEDKTKVMVSTRLDQCVNVDSGYNYEVVDEFIYLGFAPYKNNYVGLEIKRRIVLAN